MGDDAAFETALLDVRELDEEFLSVLEETALAHAIRRVLSAAEDVSEATLGFQQSI